MMYNETQMQIALTNLCDKISKHIDDINNKKKAEQTEFENGVKFGLNDCRKELRKIIDESW